MTPPFLSLQGITKSFGATRALAGVDLDVYPGEAVALMGANGAGKSTLVKILCGLERADRGSIRIDGQVEAIASPGQANRAGIVAVHQSIADVCVSTLTVAENLVLDELCLGRAPAVIGPRAIRLAAGRRAARIGLAIALDRPLSQLTPAERQLVAIARALAHEPRLLILDEPTASLSAAEAERVFAIVEHLKADGVAVLFVSHKTSDLRRLADRAVVLRDGRVADAFARPIDYSAAIRVMVGRDGPVHAVRGVSDAAPAVLSLAGVRLFRSECAFDLVVRRGETVAITGSVGAGKSTLAGALFGLWPFAAGQIELDGRPFRPRGPAESIAAGVFLAAEDRWRSSFFPPPVPFAGIAGTISFPFLKRWSRAGLVSLARERASAIRAIADFGIKAAGPDQRLSALSGGNQQKVVLARWHAEPARLLLLDEPFQGVDIGARADIVAAIRERSADRATVVFVNDHEEALAIGDRILVMEDGALSPDASVRPDRVAPPQPAAVSVTAGAVR